MKGIYCKEAFISKKKITFVDKTLHKNYEETNISYCNMVDCPFFISLVHTAT